MNLMKSEEFFFPFKKFFTKQNINSHSFIHSYIICEITTVKYIKWKIKIHIWEMVKNNSKIS